MIIVVKSFTSGTEGSPDIIFQILESYTSCVASNLIDRPNHMCNLSLHTYPVVLATLSITFLSLLSSHGVHIT
jgi:hypothetical protein